MTDEPRRSGRRTFLKTAGLMAAAAACAPSRESSPSERATDSTAEHAPHVSAYDATLLSALGATVLPAALGGEGQRAAVTAFVAWCDGYEPVAEEMHGYGYSDVRYLPADPVPAWRAQLVALDLLARRVHHAGFATLDPALRQSVVEMALRNAPGEVLPSPLDARHIAVALLAHWASTPEAWNRALGVVVSPETCRPLSAALDRPAPLPGGRA